MLHIINDNNDEKTTYETTTQSSEYRLDLSVENKMLKNNILIGIWMNFVELLTWKTNSLDKTKSDEINKKQITRSADDSTLDTIEHYSHGKIPVFFKQQTTQI